MDRLVLLQKFFQTIRHTTDPQKIATTLANSAKQVVPFEDWGIFFLEGENGRLQPLTCCSKKLQKVMESYLEEGVIDWVLEKGKPTVIADMESPINPTDSPSRRNYILSPLILNGGTTGVFVLKSKLKLSEKALRLLSLLVDRAAAAIENANIQDELKRAEDDIRQFQAQLVHSGKLVAIGELAGSIAHEINNPMTAILGRLQLLLMQGSVPKRTIPKLKTVEREVKRVISIVRGLLDFTRKEMDSPELKFVDINQTLRRSLELTRHHLEVEGIAVRAHLDGRNPKVMGKEQQLQQVFINLMINAKQAMDRGGELLIRSRVEGGKVQIEFKDTGIGIPKENLSRIFEPFFTTKASAGGTGLGLYISDMIVREHRGRIKVASQLNKGSTFTVELPIKSR